MWGQAMNVLQQRLATALGDRYLVERELGRGGMATVYLVHDVATETHVAIKLLDPELAAAVGGERFRREIEIATRLTHPHILPVLGSGEAAGSLYCVMPFVRGESLRARLERDGPLPIEVAVQLTCEVAEALDYAHQRGVVHRDIKPENILLENGHALVADFGIARAVGASDQARLTQTGVTLGTPLYMSPEQSFADKGVDGRSDIYSLGCVLYELLAGQPPFTGANAQAIMARHFMEEMPSLSVVRSTVPDHVEDAVICALAKTPADRFQTGCEFAAALRAPGPRTGTRRIARPGRPDRRQQLIRRFAYSFAALVPTTLAMIAAWTYLRPRTLTANEAVAARRVAVMYFDDFGQDGKLAPLADGLTESLIDALAQVSQLDVVSRYAVAPLRAATPDSVGRALRVGTIVRGRVEPARGDSVLVSVSLVNASTGETIGRTASIKQAASNALALRDSLSQRVAEQLRGYIGEEVHLRETRAGTTNVAAWTSVQRAERLRRHADSLWRASDTTASHRSLAQADSLLAAAVRLDAQWSEPATIRGQIAQRRAQMAIREPLVAGQWIEAGLGHAARALALNRRDAAALELRGALHYARLIAGLAPDPLEAKEIVRTAEQDLRTALRIDPHRASAWVVLSQVDYRKLDIPGANLAARRAYEEDAYLTAAPDVVWRLFVTSYDMEDALNASHWCDVGVERFATDVRFYRCQLALMTMRESGKPDVRRAWRLLGELERRTPKAQWPYEGRWQRMIVAGALARAGLADSARHVLVSARAGRDVDPRGELVGYEAFIRTLIGDNEEAIQLLQQYLTANPEHREGFVKLNSWWWRGLREDPRFRELMGTA